MIIARPTVEEERWLQLAERYPELNASVAAAGQGGRWKSTTWLARLLGFVLGLIAAGMLAGLLTPLGSPWIVGGLILVAVAEWLVAHRRVYRSGFEEALYLCGSVAIVVQVLVWSDGNNEALGVALICAGVAAAGWRLLNPPIITLAAAGFSLSIALIDTRLLDSRMNFVAAAVCSTVVACAALIATGRNWRRPSHDQMLESLVVVMPWCAHGWLLASPGTGGSRDAAALTLAAGFLVVNGTLGIRRRAHAPLIGALGNLACAGSAAFLLLDWPAHWEMIAAGALLLLAATGVERALRGRTEGLTMRPSAEPAGLDLAQMAGAAHLAAHHAPSPAPAPEPAMQGQGGEFGGGGASGRF